MRLRKLLSILIISSAFATPLHAQTQESSDQIIIKYKTAATTAQIMQKLQASSAVASQYGVSLTQKREIFNGASVVSLGKSLPKSSLSALIKAIANSDSSIEYVEEDLKVQHTAVPNDPYYSQQWHYFEAQGGINLDSAWSMSTGSGVNVAVIDTGYRPHSDLVANIVQGYDFISNTSVSNDGDGRDGDASDPGDGCGGKSSWHGTHVAGTIAARTNNGVGVAGIAYNAHIVPVRVLGCGGGYTSDVADGIVWAAGGSIANAPANQNPANVINLSLGGAGGCGSTYQNAINAARTHNTVVVVAAGNENTDASNFAPANCSGVITVAATNRSGGKAWYSNFGSAVEIAAPGGDTSSNAADGVLSTFNSGYSSPGGDSYAFSQGTSMATPHVSGIVALIKSVEPRLTPDQILQILQASAKPFPNSCSGCGAGIVRATEAVYSSLFSMVPLYSYWNASIGDHFYTIDRNDAGYAYFGYTYENINSYLSSKARDNFIPLYRYWNGSSGDHFYTTSRNDAGYAAFGYTYERIEGYVKASANNGFVPLNRYWNPSNTDHFYSPIRNDAGYGYFGYSFEGIEGYVKAP